MHIAQGSGHRASGPAAESGSCNNCLIIGFCSFDFAFCAHNICFILLCLTPTPMRVA